MTTSEQPVIRRPTAAEVPDLPEIETESHRLYDLVGMSLVAAGNEPDLAGLQTAHAAGNLLIADCDGVVAGFIECRPIDETLYVAGVSIRSRFGRRGIGAMLLAAAECLAHAQDLTRLSLTTFRDVPWNAPYYQRLGWRGLAEAATPSGLAAIRARQREAGYERWPRVTMIKNLPDTQRP
ncbi:GNAT family N-acetyltransferase [Flexivirga alba]|uniref:GNAT family N-acetyltransferase n=1 Tax=Flexivirga alba TaxID=702742 RepID=A0ABW2AKE2_9MICO